MPTERKCKRIDAEYVRNFYDTLAQSLEGDYSKMRWGESEYNRYEYKQTMRSLAKALGTQKFQSVLEVGAGDGAWTELFLQHAMQMTIIDISGEMIAGAKRKLVRFPHLRFVCKDFLDNDFESGKQDLLCAVRCFEYFPDKKKSVQEMHRILKPGGAVILITKNPLYRWWIMRGSESKLLHRGQVSPRLLKKIFEDEGFTVRGLWPAILGKKMGLAPARFFFDIVHRVSLSRWRWLVPGVIKKYFSESFLIYAIKK